MIQEPYPEWPNPALACDDVPLTRESLDRLLIVIRSPEGGVLPPLTIIPPWLWDMAFGEHGGKE